MNGSEIVDVLGKSSDSGEVRSMMSTFGVSKRLFVPRGDIEARVDLTRRGISFGFRFAPDAPKSLLFSWVMFYAGKGDRFSVPFAEPLPFGLDLGLTMAGVVRALGKPRSAKPRLGRTLWMLGGISLGITFDDGPSATMVDLSASLPA